MVDHWSTQGERPPRGSWGPISGRPELKWTRTGASTEGGIFPPKKAGDVGYDLAVSEGCVLGIQDEAAMIPTGVAVQIPQGYWGFIHARSSALSSGIVVYSGIIDEGYRGELFCRAHSLVEDTYVKPGTRLAQLILIPAVVLPTQEVDALEPSERGATGFGSTGDTHGI